MIYIFSPKEVREMDAEAIASGIPGITLMENAGLSIFKSCLKLIPEPEKKKWIIFTGSGNNAGDGFVLARHLAEAGIFHRIVSLRNKLTGDAELAQNRYEEANGKSWISELLAPDLIKLDGEDTIFVDALLGTGIEGKPSESFATAIRHINSRNSTIISIDVPSGLDSLTGDTPGESVRADITLTLVSPKTGLFLKNGPDCSGKIETLGIGIPEKILANNRSNFFLLTDEDARHLFQKREIDTHKGTYGHLGIIAGSGRYFGAATLQTRAALKAGCGLITNILPAGLKTFRPMLPPESIQLFLGEPGDEYFTSDMTQQINGISNSFKSMVVGSGLTEEAPVQGFIKKLKPSCKRLILDADALNLISSEEDLRHRCRKGVIITPHPGEFAKLLKLIGSTLNAKQINADRLGLCSRFSQEYDCITVLKGSRTLISSPDGNTAIIQTGNPGMAKAGMGDVLAGFMAGLYARHVDDFETACAGVYIHALAGDIAAAEKTMTSMTPSDLIDFIPAAIKKICASGEC